MHMQIHIKSVGEGGGLTLTDRHLFFYPEVQISAHFLPS